MILSEGKLPAQLLSKLIKTLPTTCESLIIPPGIGIDAAGLNLDEGQWAVTSDPITFTTEKLGQSSVEVNINDIACMGAKPLFYTGTLLLPLETKREKVESIWQDLAKTLQKYDITAIGGHCEVTSSVNLPIIAGQMIGRAIDKVLLNPNNILPGHKLYLYQDVAIEGTALLAEALIKSNNKTFSNETLTNMQQLYDNPGICIWPFVDTLLPNKDVVALHDPTEGGIATAIHELCDVSNCGIELTHPLVIREDTLMLSTHFNIDPLGLISSGSLLIVTREDANLIRDFPNEPLFELGTLTRNKVRTMSQMDTKAPLPRFESDEIIKALNRV